MVRRTPLGDEEGVMFQMSRRKGPWAVVVLVAGALGTAWPAGGAPVVAEEPAVKGAPANPDPKAKAKAKGETGATPTVQAVPGGVKTQAKKLSIEEQYVRDNLAKHLNPTSIAFLDDGRVRLTFDLSAKKPEHETIFMPPVSNKPSDTFRWTNRDDEYYSTYTTTGVDGTYGYMRGLRLSNSGSAHLDAWFLDDVEAEIWYVGSATSTRRQAASVVFTNAKQVSIGSDHGTLCVTYSKGVPAKAPRGTFDTILTHTLVKLKLVVRNGAFEAWRDGKKRESMEYKPKDFASGKIGFLWRDARSFVSRLEVTGRIDAKKMAADLRKARK
jgi:hypothetical protein